MKISVSNLEPTKVKLTVTVDPEEFNPYLDEARKEIAKQVNVPGFRKGHVPGKIIDQRIGFAAVAGEAVNNAVPELYSKALDEKKIRPMAQPEFDVQDVPQSANDETKLKFTATVERRPDIELPEIDGLEIAISKPEVTDEDVDKRLETLRQRFGTLVGVDRPAAKGDFANIDLTAEIDGETVDSQEGVSYELGSNTMLDGLDEALDGLSAGEETTFEGTLEAGEHEGQKATVKVKVNSVKAEELPELMMSSLPKLPSSTLSTSSRLTSARLPLRTPKVVRPPRLAMPSSPSCRKASRSRCRRASRPKWSKSSSRA